MSKVTENQQHTECSLLHRTLRTRQFRRRFFTQSPPDRNALMTSLSSQPRISLTWKRKGRSPHIERRRNEHKPEAER